MNEQASGTVDEVRAGSAPRGEDPSGVDEVRPDTQTGEQDDRGDLGETRQAIVAELHGCLEHFSMAALRDLLPTARRYALGLARRRAGDDADETRDADDEKVEDSPGPTDPGERYEAACRELQAVRTAADAIVELLHDYTGGVNTSKTYPVDGAVIMSVSGLAGSVSNAVDRAYDRLDGKAVPTDTQRTDSPETVESILGDIWSTFKFEASGSLGDAGSLESHLRLSLRDALSTLACESLTYLDTVTMAKWVKLLHDARQAQGDGEPAEGDETVSVAGDRTRVMAQLNRMLATFSVEFVSELAARVEEEVGRDPEPKLQALMLVDESA